MSSVLVTGASGFMGRTCLDFLARSGWTIHAVSRRPQIPNAATVWHTANAKDVAQMRTVIARCRPTHLLHLAWCTDPRTFWNSPENEEWLRASVKLFDTFDEFGGSRIVGVGSCAEYDWSQGMCHELKTPCRPQTLYGETKWAAGRYLELLSRQGLGTAWARLFFLYGPGASPARIPGAVISSLGRGEVAKCSVGSQRRDFLYVTDAARAIVSLVESAICGPVNICSGTAIPIAAIAERAAELLGRRDLLHLGAVPTPPNDPPLIAGNNSRLKTELCWHAEYSLDHGLQATIDHWLTNQVSRRREAG